AMWGSPLLLHLAPPLPVAIPIEVNLAPDWRVLGFGFALSTLIGLLLGLTAAVRAMRGDPAAYLKSGAALSRPGRKWASPRDLLVAGQVALSIVLLVAAGLFVESLRNARRMDLGFDPSNRLSLSVNAAMQRYTPVQGLQHQNEA